MSNLGILPKFIDAFAQKKVLALKYSEFLLLQEVRAQFEEMQGKKITVVNFGVDITFPETEIYVGLKGFRGQTIRYVCYIEKPTQDQIRNALLESLE